MSDNLINAQARFAAKARFDRNMARSAQTIARHNVVTLARQTIFPKLTLVPN